jgi:HD-GYP domain-containing protein (c-di-GMP phosphodiesterase class II)
MVVQEPQRRRIGSPPGLEARSIETAWDVLERFGVNLDQGGPASAVRLALEAVRDSLGADTVYWHPGSGPDRFEQVGDRDLSASWCRRFTEQVLAQMPGDPGQVVRAFLDPGAKLATPWPCSAALVRVQRSRSIWLGALSFHPRRLFDATDLKIMLVARRLVLGQRQQVHAAERLKESVFGLMRCLAAALDARDPMTWGHSERVARIAVRLGQQMGLPAASLHDLYLAGLLHDIGKIGLRDSVLQKAGPLTPEEQVHVQEHPVIGDRLVAHLRPLRHLCPGVRHHHERWDGQGYPDGLSGQAIPLPARVLALADACDAMLAPRAHRPALTTRKASAVLREEAGARWDPELIEHFLNCRQELFALCRHGPAESVAGVIDRALELGGPVMDDFLEAGPAERQAAVSRAGGMKSGPWGEGR